MVLHCDHFAITGEDTTEERRTGLNRQTKAVRSGDSPLTLLPLRPPRAERLKAHIAEDNQGQPNDHLALGPDVPEEAHHAVQQVDQTVGQCPEKAAYSLDDLVAETPHGSTPCTTIEELP